MTGRELPPRRGLRRLGWLLLGLGVAAWPAALAIDVTSRALRFRMVLAGLALGLAGAILLWAAKPPRGSDGVRSG